MSGSDVLSQLKQLQESINYQFSVIAKLIKELEKKVDAIND